MFPIISIGPINFPAEPMILILGFWAGATLANKRALSNQHSAEILDKILWIGLLAGIIGARLSFIARNPAAFQGNLLSVISLNPALLDKTAGILLFLLAGYYLISKNQLNTLDVLDDLVPLFAVFLPAFFLAQFAAGKSFGTFTSLPWGIDLWGGTRHPVQIYYFLGSIAVLILLYSGIIKRKITFAGKDLLSFVLFTSGYLTFFSAFQDPGDLILEGFRITQILSWCIFCLSLFIINRVNKGRQPYEIS